MDSKLPIYIFTDFDGTVTLKDIGDEIFKEFGQFEPYNSQLKAGEIDIKTYWQTICDTLKPDLTEQDIVDYALSADIDSWFVKFVNYCEQSGFPLSVVSDGFSSYINPILKKLGLDNLPVRCNHLEFTDNGRVVPHYPLASESCNCLCASCKRNAVLTDIPVDSIIVFIGDGYSDFCAAEHADIIFAKKNLAAYCVEHKIPHYHFSNFFDIQRIFTEIIPQKKLKVRNQAKQLRNKAFETE